MVLWGKAPQVVMTEVDPDSANWPDRTNLLRPKLV